MIKGYDRGVEAAAINNKKHTQYHVFNSYPEWCAEHKRFNAGLKGEPDPNRTPTKRRNLGAQG